MVAPYFIIATWAVLFTTVLNKPNEVFSDIASRVNIYLFNSPHGGNPDTLKGFRLVMWKYCFCAKCHAGIVALIYSFWFSYLNREDVINNISQTFSGTVISIMTAHLMVVILERIER